MILGPEQYESASTSDLLSAAALGQVGIDSRLLGELVRRGPDVLPVFERFLAEPREDDRFPIEEDLAAAARHLRTSAALPFLAELVRQYEFHIFDELQEAFWEIGAASLETLVDLHREAAGEPDPLFALAGLRVHDPRVLEALVDQLRTDPLEAALNLGMYGDPAALPALREALAQAAPEDQAVRRALENAIEEIEAGHALETPAPYDLFAHYSDEEEPRFAALDETELVEFLASPMAAYRARAVRTLAFDGIPPTLTARILDMARNDPETRVRAECWEALDGSLEEPGVREALVARLAEEAAPLEERCGALIALATEAGDQPALRATILEFYRKPGARAPALKAMWRSMDRRFAEYIAPNLDDPELEVRRQAVAAAGWLGAVSLLGRLESFFEDEDLREAALYAYALAAPGEVSPARVRRTLRKIEELAGGLSHTEGMLVRQGLDNRLQMHGLDPIFADEETWEEDGEEPPEDDRPARPVKTGRNDPCPCGSGKKYKKCCG